MSSAHVLSLIVPHILRKSKGLRSKAVSTWRWAIHSFHFSACIFFSNATVAGRPRLLPPIVARHRRQAVAG